MTGPTSGIAIEVDSTIYSESALMRAAYKFTGQFHVVLARDDARPQRVVVNVSPKTANVSLDERVVRGEFLNELLDQQLREKLEAEFGAVRELILAQAFADTNLLDANRDEGDYVTDPLHIGDDTPGPRPAARVAASTVTQSGPVGSATSLENGLASSQGK